MLKINCYPKADNSNGKKTKFELYLSNYAAKSEVRKATCVEALEFGKKADWGTLNLRSILF